MTPGRVAAGLVRGYQLLLRPLLPAVCRFDPSCSEYARRSLWEHGAMRGGWLALRRVGRCHPWHPGGFDPPPPGKSSTSMRESIREGSGS